MDAAIVKPIKIPIFNIKPLKAKNKQYMFRITVYFLASAKNCAKPLSVNG